MVITVGVIGGGPGGLAAVRALSSIEKLKVDVFEQSSGFGGIWTYTGNGPLYDELCTNIPHWLMEFKDIHFPENTPQLASRQSVYEYVLEYSNKFKDGATFHFNTRIDKVTKKDKNQWEIHSNENVWFVDHIIVASGHNSSPLYPAVNGIKEWMEREPDTISHSKTYDNPEPFRGQRLLVVGAASSGVDIALQALAVTDRIIVSVRVDVMTDISEYVNVKPALVGVDHKTHSVYFEDGSTEVVDMIVFCTGYLYDYPFLDEYSSKQERPVLHETRIRVCNTYLDMFYLEDPTLVFLGLGKHIVPMPFIEAQASVVAGVWSGALKLPSLEKMREIEYEKVTLRGDTLQFHSLGYPKDVEAMTILWDFADSTEENTFRAERWGADKIELRKNIKALKGVQLKEMAERSLRRFRGA